MIVCALILYPATPGWVVRRGCVCFGWGFGCAPPILSGVLECLCVRVRAPLVPRHSWAGCAVWVCVFGLGSRLRHATPGWGVRVCVFVCALLLYPAAPPWGVRRACVCLVLGSSCAPPLLARVLRFFCIPVRALLVPRDTWLGCAVWLFVFGLGFRLRPATPGWGVPLCVFVCALCLYPATPGWGVRRGCVCFSFGFGCAPTLLAGVLGCVCVLVRAPLAPSHFWLGSLVWVGVLGAWLQLRPATPGWGVGLCVFVCALGLYPANPGWGVRRGCVWLGSGFRSAPPLLAGVLGCLCAAVRAPLVPSHSWLGCPVLVCVYARVRAPPLPHHSWLGCWGVCVCLRAPPVPRHSWLRFVVGGLAACAVVRCVLCAPPGFAATGGRCCLASARVYWLWLAACLSGVPLGPALVRRASSSPVALGAPVGFSDAVVPFPTPGACAPRITARLRGAGGGLPRTWLFVPAAGTRRGRSTGLAPRCTRLGPRDGVVPGGSPWLWFRPACAAVICVCGPGH